MNNSNINIYFINRSLLLAQHRVEAQTLFQNSSLHKPLNRVFKRVFDIGFSLFICVFLLSWLIPIIAIFIRIDSKGPIFFKQKRHGLNGQVFWCWKLRTMNQSSLQNTSRFRQTCKNDERITCVGKWLRQTSLDELPQFLNVLMGEMSVIGPRPYPIELSALYKNDIRQYHARLVIRPGVSGFAQASGHRGAIFSQRELETRNALDQYYIMNWSFGLDLKIIYKTIISLLLGNENAF